MPGGGRWATAFQLRTPEADLHRPIKEFLEAQGYEVEGEIGSRDLVAVRGVEGTVAVELGERLTLGLVLRAVDRLTFSDAVYVAFRAVEGRAAGRDREKVVLDLLRRLGLGLLTVSERGDVVPVLDPGSPTAG